ncbi:methyltransferase family protein [Knoellia sp. LjRoot47]|uniref:methyltransferase family protein n=1 Tax=Knoellia sp. LjRoot47 TaxID=3342330 RepID=UPI003ECE09F0
MSSPHDAGRESGRDAGRGSGRVVGFRLWPPVAVGVPLLAGLALTGWAGDPFSLGAWRVPVGWVLVTAFVAWNGWALLLFARHGTGLLPRQETSRILQSGPFAVSRNPLYVGLVALHLGVALLVPSTWSLLLLPASAALLHWGAIVPEERFLTREFGEDYLAYAARVRRWL